MNSVALTSILLAMGANPVVQDASAPASVPMPVSTPAPAPTATAPLQVQTKQTTNAKLPANTEVLLKMNQEVTTKGKTWDEGDTFALTVVHDVLLGDYVVIPSGSRATGRITWMTNKGMFGKSGKMDIELEHVTVNGRRIDLEGTYRQEGEGNTVATVAGVIAIPLAGLFITGRSGRIPQGRELMATTESDIELAIPASSISQGVAPLSPTRTAEPSPMPVAEAAVEAAADPAPAPAAPTTDIPTTSEPVVQETAEEAVEAATEG